MPSVEPYFVVATPTGFERYETYKDAIAAAKNHHKKLNVEIVVYKSVAIAGRVDENSDVPVSKLGKRAKAGEAADAGDDE